MLALTTGGEVLLRSGPQAGWHVLVTERALAATPAGRSCGLTGLTAVAFGPGGTPLLGGGCTSARVRARSSARMPVRHWQLAGPVPDRDRRSAARGRRTAVLALATDGGVTTAVIRTGVRPGARGLAASAA